MLTGFSVRRIPAFFLLTFGIVSALTFLTPPSGVFAHAVLDNSVPASGATIASSPAQIVLDFDEKVETALGYVRLFASDGKRIALPGVSSDVSDPSIIRTNVPTLKDDTYVAVYRVQSSDGHPVEGAITFRVGEGPLADVNNLVATALASSENSQTTQVVKAMVRFLGYLSVALVFAGIFFGFYPGFRSTEKVEKVRCVIVVGAAGLLLSSFLLVLLQGVDVTGGSLKNLISIDNARGVLDTRVGHALGARGFLSLLLLIAGLISIRRRAAQTQVFEFVSVLVFIATPFTFAFAGHASVGSPQILSIVASVAHVAAVATWFGGLLVLILVQQVRTHPIVEWFSTRAAILIAVAVVSGAVSSLIIVDGITEIAETPYGVGLLVKVAFVGAMLLVAAMVRRRFHESGVATLRSLLIAEALVGVVVLGLSAGITGASPREEVSNAPFSTSLVQGDIIASITLAPARTGQAEMHVILSPPNGSLSPVVGAKARFSLLSRDLPAIQVALSSVGPNHYVGLLQIPYTGEWQLDVVVNATANAELLYRTKVTIRQ